ncbi:uncharacterized protein [Embiotoca jacksoni]|uniref:uncharacterized protein n=1 Tax=Embiotoca jacksoni TaxID=100190 RepID=UPI0037039817
MSGEKSPEVAGCDASIMTNLWAIREREYMQKIQQEDERMERSALPSINKDWASRLSAKLGSYKRVERKPKLAESQADNNIWKSKQPQVPPTLPRGSGSDLGRPGVQNRGFSTPASNKKDKKGQDKTSNRLQLLVSITQTQPSALVWGKSWKYNKSLPSPAEGPTATSSWGQCWMFATQQPYSEAGEPWVNGPNFFDPHSLHLWRKPGCRVVDSQDLDLSLPPEEWQISWRKSDKNNQADSSGNGENVPKDEFFTLLMETQHHNEALYSSEWSESWTSTKPADRQDPSTVPDDGLMNESVSNAQDEDREMSSEWEECWKRVNHHCCNRSKLPQKSHSLEWVNSWRAAMAVLNNHKNSNPSVVGSEKKRSSIHETPQEHKYKDLYLQLCSEFEALSEWSKSWQVTKNNSKPCEEIEKVLKAAPPRMETGVEAQRVEKNHRVKCSTPERADARYDELKHDVMYMPRRKFTYSKLLILKNIENTLASEWRDSWKVINHRMRVERRRMRSDPLKPFRESEKGETMRPSASEWKNSWKYTCQPLNQEPDQWQQGWSTTAPILVSRALNQNHFVPVELPKNGPTTELSWGESWRFSRHQHRSQSVQGNSQVSQRGSSVASHLLENPRSQETLVESISDWQAAWMVSETEFRHDRPSLTQWREAWMWSVYHIQHWTEQVPRVNRVDETMEIQPVKEKTSLQSSKAKMSRSFDNHIFRERYPEKDWSTSWSAGSLLNHQPGYSGSSGMNQQSVSSTTQQQHGGSSEYGSKWGRSFRLANPMPHIEQPWVESWPNPGTYSAMWSRGKKIQNDIRTNFCTNPATFKLWGSSHRFLQGAGAQSKDKSKQKVPSDVRVIVAEKTRTRRTLFSIIEKEKQSERRLAGCHLLGKTQPRPKKGPGSVKIQLKGKTKDKFFEEWAESWRFLVRPVSLKKQMSLKSPSGWDESWKFLIPLYQPMNGLKAK